MSVLRRGRTLAAIALLLAMGVDAQPEGGNKRQGNRAASCGHLLTLVPPNGKASDLQPAEKLFEGLRTIRVDQGETPRTAVSLDDLLKTQQASSVVVTDCDGGSAELPSGLPVEGAYYVVLTGRGTLKIVREVRPGQYVNQAQAIRKLAFRGAGS